ncbi:MAG: aminoglycoside phosphotransferase family protein [Chloroflexi bacterium]|nr:aminoglycoside phosphotransferase family protein [Chloroflexota bacterium]MCL5273607.1 aminoglycoside phosphotransferase family protein [Chloroflexota bacterium]
MDRLIRIAEQFNTNGPVVSVREYGTGNVNDTYLVQLEAPRQARFFILQRINRHVFRRPELIMLNMRALGEHVQSKLARESIDHRNGRRWEIPRVFTTRNGDGFHVDEENEFWRAISFIDHSTAYPRIIDSKHAREAGYALGRFHSLISDMPIERLHDTLEGFHIAPGYLRHYDEVLARYPHANGTGDERRCMAFVETHRNAAAVLEDAKANGKLPVRPMHGDPKIDNIMIDDDMRQAVSMIDLDTVKPGLVHYDLGDCLRSCCNLLGEETADVEHVRFETDLGHDILSGYFSVAGDFFTGYDYDYLYDAIHLIAFELGLRFFTDHLEGNIYFKARHAEHNLQRALVQFKLAESIEGHADEIRRITADFKVGAKNAG